ncbi:MAG: DUF924 domain-containing protein [Rhodobacteraceae bacterium]|nr:DUF924 domain-containing protein [Paracoccaceae bacterium]
MSDETAIIEFWLQEVGPKGWYDVVPAVDAEIRARYLGLWEAAHEGACEHWLNGPRGALAYLILTDQFPRNMFRGDPRSFATDARARHASEESVAHGWDVLIPEPERQFFYLPLMHSEDIADQDRGIALIESSMPETGAGNLTHARVHREIIRRFGRFPYRNAALGRQSTADEQAFLDEGGYRKILQSLGKT